MPHTSATRDPTHRGWWYDSRTGVERMSALFNGTEVFDFDANDLAIAQNTTLAGTLTVDGASTLTGATVVTGVLTASTGIVVSATGIRIAAGRFSEKLTAVDDDSQSMTLAAADILAGINVHTSTSSGGTVTVDTAANIISGVPLTVDDQCVVSYYINDGSQTVTFAVADGTAIADTGSTVLTNEAAVLLWRRTSSSAVTLYILH